jgi:hypothetical protein
MERKEQNHIFCLNKIQKQNKANKKKSMAVDGSTFSIEVQGPIIP